MIKEGPEGFAAAWFRAHGFAEEAQYVTTHPIRSLGIPVCPEPDRLGRVPRGCG